MKVPNLMKYSKLSKSIAGIINVLFWVVLGLTVAVIIISIGIRLFPGIINLSSDNGNFSISPDNIIRFEIQMGNISMENISEIYSLLFVGIALFLVIILLVLSQLRIILKNVVNEKPFAQKNAKSIMYIGYIVIAGSILIPITKAFMVNRIINAFELSNVSAVYTINSEVLIIGILLLLVSAIFSYGAYLQQEYDTTI